MKKGVFIILAIVAILISVTPIQQATALPIDCYEAAIFGGAGNGLDCVIAIIQAAFLGGPDGWGWDSP